MDTIGTTRKHISVVAENELESPWAPFHVSRGFAADDDAVTVFFTAGEWDISVQGHLDGRQLAKAIGSFSGGTYGTGYFTTLKGDTEYSGYGRLLLLAPPHAQPIATEGGFSKEDLAQFFVDEGREPVSRLIEPIRKLHADGKVKEKWEWLFELDAEEAERTTLPVLDRAESYSIVVVGAVRGKDLLMPTRVEPHTEPITRST